MFMKIFLKTETIIWLVKWSMINFFSDGLIDQSLQLDQVFSIYYKIKIMVYVKSLLIIFVSLMITSIITEIQDIYYLTFWICYIVIWYKCFISSLYLGLKAALQ